MVLDGILGRYMGKSGEKDAHLANIQAQDRVLEEQQSEGLGSSSCLCAPGFSVERGNNRNLCDPKELHGVCFLGSSYLSSLVKASQCSGSTDNKCPLFRVIWSLHGSSMPHMC